MTNKNYSQELVQQVALNCGNDWTLSNAKFPFLDTLCLSQLCVTAEFVRHGRHIDSTSVLLMKKPVVIDNGTGFIKAGFAGDKLPRVVSPSVVGRPVYGDRVAFSDNHKSVYVGEEAVLKRGAGLKLTFPLEHGIVSNWDDLELLWKNCLENELRVDPMEHPILLTEAPLNPKRNREVRTNLLLHRLKTDTQCS